jgi:hypothetical protein
MKPPVFVVVREIPRPSLSFVKKPVPGALTSLRLSWALAATVNSAINPTAITSPFLIFVFPGPPNLSFGLKLCSKQ